MFSEAALDIYNLALLPLLYIYISIFIYSVVKPCRQVCVSQIIRNIYIVNQYPDILE